MRWQHLDQVSCICRMQMRDFAAQFLVMLTMQQIRAERVSVALVAINQLFDQFLSAQQFQYRLQAMFKSLL